MNVTQRPLSAYFNTTSLTGDDLRHAIRQADKQDDAILAIYRAAKRPLSPSEVWAECESAGKRWPLTSIRRSITTLTNAGALARLDEQRVGAYGRPEHRWSAAA